jgi:DNA-binding NtrC family response regulator
VKDEKKSILIVEDDKNTCDALSLLLEKEGYETDIAYTGKKAMDKAKEKTFDVALLDIRLPDVEGTELLAEFGESTPRTVKIIVTGYPTTENAIEAVRKEADDYLVKPVMPDKLLEAIERGLKKRKEEDLMTEEKVKVFVKERTARLLQTNASQQEERTTR